MEFVDAVRVADSLQLVGFDNGRLMLLAERLASTPGRIVA